MYSWKIIWLCGKTLCKHDDRHTSSVSPSHTATHTNTQCCGWGLGVTASTRNAVVCVLNTAHCRVSPRLICQVLRLAQVQIEAQQRTDISPWMDTRTATLWTDEALYFLGHLLFSTKHVFSWWLFLLCWILNSAKWNFLWIKTAISVWTSWLQLKISWKCLM